MHNRSIASRIDDSVVRVIADSGVVLRAGRGFAPLVLDPPQFEKSPIRPTERKRVIGLGAHHKNTIALGDEAGRILLMPHLGNLDTSEARDAYFESLQKLMRIRGISESRRESLSDVRMASDLHPDFYSTQVAQSIDPSTLRVQHHEAHLLSCVAEHRIQGPILGVAWDGTGYGEDGSVWGGEFFCGTEAGFTHLGGLRKFRLPGGTAAVQEPRRSALGVLFELFSKSRNEVLPETSIEGIYGEAHFLGFKERELKFMVQGMMKGLNAPKTSSAGRLFDAVAALLGLCTVADYEGQAAGELEAAAGAAAEKYSGLEWYPVRKGPLVEPPGEPPGEMDWKPWILGILEDRNRGLPVERIAAKFHRTLAHSIVRMAQQAGISQVILSGGCFQNRLLCEWTVSMLRKEGFQPFWNQKVPPNNGGISVGQVIGGWNVLVSSGKTHGSSGQ